MSAQETGENHHGRGQQGHETQIPHGQAVYGSQTLYASKVIAAVRDWDDSRDRSVQAAVGWSELHGCRAYMGFRIRQDWATEDVDTWGAIRGTALHMWLQDIRASSLNADDADEISFEVPVSYRGIPGHADEVNYTKGEVTDYKFPSLRSAKMWDDPAVLDERFGQGHGYAAGLVGSRKWEFAPDPQSALVRILVCPVDGTFSDWRCYEREFDRRSADEAADRYYDAVHAVDEGDPLPKDMPWHFCKRWCEFYSLCRGGDHKEPSELPEIEDAELAAAVERYGLANERMNEASKERDQIRPLIEGLRGRARGFKVYQSHPGRSGWEPDMEEIQRWFAAQDLQVPMRQRDGKRPSLYVVRDE